MKEDYIILTVKAAENAIYGSGSFEVALVYYSQQHIEKTRSLVCLDSTGKTGGLREKTKDKTLRQKEIDKFCSILAHAVGSKKIIMYGQAGILSDIFSGYGQEVPVELLDCECFIKDIFPFLKGYGFNKVIELFRLQDMFDGPYADCLRVHCLFLYCMRALSGKGFHEIVPCVESFLSGYWEQRAVPEQYARLTMFGKHTITVAGRFRSLYYDMIHKIIKNSDGNPQALPDDRTSILVIGNSEFSAKYQSRAFHEALLRIRRNQQIRIVSELELLSLLHGQFTWQKQVNPYYASCADVVPVFSKMVFGNGSGNKTGDIPGFPFPVKKDDSNTRKHMVGSAKHDSILSAILGS